MDTSHPPVDSWSEQDPLLSFASEEPSGGAVAAGAKIHAIPVPAGSRAPNVHEGLQKRWLTRATDVNAIVRSHWARSRNRPSVSRLKTVRARREVSRWSVRYSRFAVGVAVGALIASAGGSSPTSRNVTSPAVADDGVLQPSLVPPTREPGAADVVGTSLIVPPAPARSATSGRAAAGRPAVTPAAASPAPPRPSGHRGTLIVRSQPIGASVFVNNRLAGTTPLVLNALPVGSRAVRLSLDGYAPWSRAVSVVTNQSTTVSAKLQRNDGGDSRRDGS